MKLLNWATCYDYVESLTKISQNKFQPYMLKTVAVTAILANC